MITRIITTVLVLVVLVTGGIFITKSLRAATAGPSTQYRVAEVKRDTVKKTVTATGTLTPWSVADIKSKAGGLILKLYVDAGTVVKKGDPIAWIDPTDTELTFNSAKADIEAGQAHIEETKRALDLQRQQSQNTIDTAVATLEQSKAATQSAKARYESAKSQAEAQTSLTQASVDNAHAMLVSEQARLAQMEKASHPTEEATARANLHQANANLVNAEAQLKRQRSLAIKGYIAQSQVDTAEAAYESAQAVAQDAQKKVDTLQQNLDADLEAEKAHVSQLEAAYKSSLASRVDIQLKKQAAQSAWADYQTALATERANEVRVREARAEQLNNSIKQAQILQAVASRQKAQATYDNAKTTLNQTRVSAPNDGIILKKYVDQGTMITSGMSFNSSGTSIVQLGDISRQYIDVQVDESDVAGVDLGQPVDITFDAYPTTPFEGKVIKIEPTAVVDSNVTTIHVRVEVDNTVPSYRLLKPGMDATCEFIVNKKEDVVAVPNEAVHTDTDGNRYVEIAKGGKVAPADKDSEPDPNLLVGVTVVKRPVEVGLEGNDSTEVTKGVQEGDRIITQTIEPSTGPPAGGNPFGGSRGPGRR